MEAEVSAFCIGLPQPFNGAELSAIAKRPVSGPVAIRSFGIEGDMVADTRVHGGPDMAVHQYPLDHYEWWRTQIGHHPLLGTASAFGENIVARGIVETDVAIGDRFRIGSAVLEVSQPRQPCWKIEHRFQQKAMVKAIIQSNRSGWYFRVIEEGEAKAGDRLKRIERGHDDWTVARVFAKLLDPAEKATSHELEAIANLDRLAPRVRDMAAKALDS